MGEEASTGIFCIVREIDHFCWVILGDDRNVADEGIMGALELFDGCNIQFVGDFVWGGILEVGKCLIFIFGWLGTLGNLGTLGDF